MGEIAYAPQKQVIAELEPLHQQRTLAKIYEEMENLWVQEQLIIETTETQPVGMVEALHAQLRLAIRDQVQQHQQLTYVKILEVMGIFTVLDHHLLTETTETQQTETVEAVYDQQKVDTVVLELQQQLQTLAVIFVQTVNLWEPDHSVTEMTETQ